MVGQPVAAVREAVGAVHRQVFRRAVQAHAVVEVGAPVLPGRDDVAGDEAVGRQITGAELVVVDHVLVLAPHLLGLDQAADGRRGRREPDRARHHVADDPRAHVRALVAEVLVAVAGLLGAPAADGGAPLGQHDVLVPVLHVQGELRILLARLRFIGAGGVEGQVVPDVAAVDDHRQIHVGPVVLGRGR